MSAACPLQLLLSPRAHTRSALAAPAHSLWRAPTRSPPKRRHQRRSPAGRHNKHTTLIPIPIPSNDGHIAPPPAHTQPAGHLLPASFRRPARPLRVPLRSDNWPPFGPPTRLDQSSGRPLNAFASWAGASKMAPTWRRPITAPSCPQLVSPRRASPTRRPSLWPHSGAPTARPLFKIKMSTPLEDMQIPAAHLSASCELLLLASRCQCAGRNHSRLSACNPPFRSRLSLSAPNFLDNFWASTKRPF